MIVARTSTRWLGWCVVCAAIFGAVAGCPSARTVPMLQFAGETMGTTFTVKIVDPPKLDPATTEAEIKQLLDDINGWMSTYREDSELSKLNQSTSTQWFPVSKQTAAVVDEAIQVGKLTDGAFDVTVGPLVDLWHFGPTRDPRKSVPEDDAIRAAMERVGYGNIDIRYSPPSIRRARADLHIDLSGIAKGFAVDQIAEHLDSLGVANYMVEVGGEVRAKGHNRSGRPWQIAVESPLIDARQVYRVVPLSDTAMATSGDYRNYFEEDGVRYSHILDPRTGRPITHKLASVTVLSDTCMRADALATAMMVLGPDAGFELAEQEKLSILMIVHGEDGFVEKATPGFRKVVE